VEVVGDQKDIHHRDAETGRKGKSKPEGTEVAEVTEARPSRGISVSEPFVIQWFSRQKTLAPICASTPCAAEVDETIVSGGAS
jgi:hypothetical protein